MKKFLKFSISLAITTGCFWWTFKDTRWDEMWASVKSANYWYLLPYLLLLGVVHVARTKRWRNLLSGIEKVQFRQLNEASGIGFMMLIVLPFRMGEFARPFLIAERSTIRRSAAMTSVVFERIVDGIIVAVALRGLLFFVPNDHGQINRILIGANLMFAVFGGGLLFLLFARWQHDRAVRLIAATAGRISLKLGEKVAHVVDGFVGAMKQLPDGKNLAAFFFWTALYWTINGVGSIVVQPTVSTTYTLTATSPGQTQTKMVTVNATTWNAIWEAGLDNNLRTEFSHEDAADDNYYFAGDYTVAGGPNQLVNEILNDDTNTDTVAGRTGSPAVGFERAVSELDPVMNIWFVPSAALVKPESLIRVTADVLTVSGSNTLEFRMNDQIIKTQTGITSARLVQFEVTGIGSAMVPGPNKLTVRRTGTTLGGNLVFDYLMLEQALGTLPEITGITHDSILGTHTVNWTPVPGRTYRVEKSKDAGVSWITLIQGFPTGGAPGNGIFFEDRDTRPADPLPAYRVLLE